MDKTGLLVSIEVLAVVFGGWSGLEGDGDWNKVPETLPIMIFALVYHDIAPGGLYSNARVFIIVIMLKFPSYVA